MKRHDLIQDLAAARQALQASITSLTGVVLDGTRDTDDEQDLSMALDQMRGARNAVEMVCRRLQFLHKLEHLRSGSVTASGRWHTVALVRLGVDCGYAIDDVNRIVAAALGAVIRPAAAPTAPGAVDTGFPETSACDRPPRPAADPPHQCAP